MVLGVFLVGQEIQMSELFPVFLQASLRGFRIWSSGPKTMRYMYRSGNFRQYFYFRLRNYFRSGLHFRFVAELRSSRVCDLRTMVLVDSTRLTSAGRVSAGVDQLSLGAPVRKPTR